MGLWRIPLLAQRAARGFVDAGGTRLSAAIAYYALLSLIPLILVLVGAANLLFGSPAVRERIVDQIVEGLPLDAEGDEQIREILLAASAGAGTVGLIGLLGLLWTASGMMGAVRAGVTAVTGGDARRPFVLGKLVDLSMIILSGALVVLSSALTVVVRVADQEIHDRLGLPAIGPLLGMLVPVALAFLTLIVLLRFVPAEPVEWCGAWRGALFGSVALWVTGTGFAFYVDNFSRYNAIYGSLGAVVAFLVFVWIAAMVLLLTAAGAGAWPALARASGPPPKNPYGPPTSAHRVRGLLRSLVHPRRR